MSRKRKPSMKQGIEAFLGLGFAEPEKPPRRQRDARDDQMRILGFTQAQEQLRHILSQCESATAAELSNAPRHPDSPQPINGPGGSRIWIAS